MHQSLKAIVINKIRYKDNGLIVKLFTEEKGLLSFLIRRANSKKNKTAGLYQPLTILNIQALVKENATLHYIKEAKVADSLNSIHQHPIKLGISMFLSELLYKSLKEAEPNQALFHYLLYALHWLELAKNCANFPIAFMVNLSTYYGFPPQANLIGEESYFDMREGQFQLHPPNHMEFLSKEKSRYLQLFLGSNFDESSSIAIKGEDRKEILKQMINYFHIHIDHLRKIQSHLVLEETFDVY